MFILNNLYDISCSNSCVCRYKGRVTLHQCGDIISLIINFAFLSRERDFMTVQQSTLL